MQTIDNNSVSTREHSIFKVTLVGSAVNLILTLFKFAAGIFGRSGAMVADAVHSLSDLATDAVVLCFTRLSSKPKDHDHEYGHGKYETLATIIIGLALAAVGVGIIIRNIRVIHDVATGSILPEPGAIALWAAIISIVSKELLYRYTVMVGRKLNSPAVMANAWHHRSDALSSIGTLIGVGGARLLGEHWRILDPIAAIVVGVLILKVAYDLSSSSLGELLEHSLPRQTEEEILKTVTARKEVHDPHNHKTRRIGSAIAVDIHIRLNGSMTVAESHDITVEIERRLRERFGPSTIVSIHVEPIKPAPSESRNG